VVKALDDGTWRVEPTGNPLRGEWQPPGDRQMSHLALVLGAMAVGPVLIQGVLESADTVSTRRVLAHLGVSFTTDEAGWLVVTRTDNALKRPEVELDCGSSVTTLRLMAALLSGQRFSSMLAGDDELWALPLEPLIKPLRVMGAHIECVGGECHPPLRIKGQPLYPINITLDPGAPEAHDPLLLAAMFAVGESTLVEPAPGPDHLERMLRHLGANVRRNGLNLTLKGEQRVYPRRIKLPGDFAAAAPLIAAATLLPESELWIHETGTNPGRTGMLKTLVRCGGMVERQRTWQFGAEPVGSFLVRHAARLTPFVVAPNLAPSLLDEFFLLALLATQAHGTSSLKGAQVLSHTHPDMLLLAALMLQAFGAEVEYASDSLRIVGPAKLRGAEVQCANDPRLAMLGVVAAIVADGPSILHGAECLHDYYPGFVTSLNRLQEIDPAGYADAGDITS
jgi:3-phosphoshikimate 1-carboxyvinyltransferase